MTHQNQSMAMFVATLLTLLFLPALYVAWFRIKEPAKERQVGIKEVFEWLAAMPRRSCSTPPRWCRSPMRWVRDALLDPIRDDAASARYLLAAAFEHE